MNLTRCLALVLLLLVVRSSVAGIYGMADDLPPKTYASPSGRTVLTVDPSERSGAGPATYKLTRDGKVVWSASQPFTLWDAGVADDGTVAGYAYSRGFNFEKGDFIVSILDSTGSVRLLERTPRHSSRMLHTMADPKARGLFLDTGNDRFVVRVEDAGQNINGELWWSYQVSSGRPIGKGKVTDTSPGVQMFSRLIDARPIPNTPLAMVHWLRDEYSGTGRKMSARFALVDLQNQQVWKLDLTDDYAGQNYVDAQNRYWAETGEHRSILDTSQPNRFELRHVAASERVTYEVTAIPAPSTGWRVQDVIRKPLIAIKNQDAEAAIKSDIANFSLRKLGSIALDAAKADFGASPIRDIYDFAIDDRGRIGFVSQCGCDSAQDKTFVLVDGEGKLVRQIALPAVAKRGSVVRRFVWVGGEKWIVTTSEYGVGKRSSAILIDVSIGTLTPMPEFDAPMVEVLASTGDGGFIALTSEKFEYTNVAAVFAFDSSGKRLWKIGASYEDEKQLFSPKGIAVTTTGELVVLENISNKLKIYNRAGVYRTTVDLKKSWGRTPNYLSGIAADRSGGVIVHDSNGNPPIIHMALTGKVIAAVAPVFADRRRFDVHGHAQMTPDGRIWTSDGQALLRLDAKGVVDLVLGEKPNPDSLRDVAAMVVTTSGGIYAVDTRTGAIHVFDEKGKRRHVCRPEPNDYKGQLSLPALSVSDTGEVFISRSNLLTGRSNDLLHYTPNGVRVGVESIKLDDSIKELHSQPGTTNRWALGYTRAYLVDHAGAVLRRLDRTADAQWLQRPRTAGAAPNGAIAIVSEGVEKVASGTNATALIVTIFSATGEAIATWPAPKDTVTWSGKIAFDGTRFAFPVNSDNESGVQSVIMTDTLGQQLFRFALPLAGSRSRLFFVRPETSSELWVFDGKSTIDTYALP